MGSARCRSGVQDRTGTGLEGVNGQEERHLTNAVQMEGFGYKAVQVGGRKLESSEKTSRSTKSSESQRRGDDTVMPKQKDA